MGEKQKTSSDIALPRVLGLWDIVGIVVGGIIGSGIFIVPAAIAAEVKAPLLIFAVWIGGGLLSFFGALAFSELSAAYPHAGGSYIFLRESFGKLIAFLFRSALDIFCSVCRSERDKLIILIEKLYIYFIRILL